jgi:hypothetical protein
MSQVQSMALGVFADLRARRLVPVVVGLLVLLIGVPAILSKPSESPSPAPRPAAGANTAVNGLPSPERALSDNKPLVTLAALDRPSDLRSYKAKDPFKPLVPVKQAGDVSATGAGASPAGGVTAAAGGGSSPSGGSAGGGTTGGGTPGGGTPGGSTGGSGGGGGQTITNPKVKRFAYEMDATIKTPNGKKRFRHLQRLAFLPSQSNPLLIFLGVTSDGQSALVMSNGDSLHPVGGGGAHCRPSHAKCSAVWFQTGESYTFVDGKDRKYVLKVHSIKAIEVSHTADDKRSSADGSGAAAGASALGARQVPAPVPPLVDLITGG